jgi:DNA-directed RNA polymerase specialized sigma24 family protein
MAVRPSELEALYRAKRAGFRNGAALLLGDRELARDVVQDGFVQAIAWRKTFRGGSLEAWVWQIIKRKALDRRRAPLVGPLEDELDLAPVGSPADPDLGAAIRALPPRRRLIVFLRYYADLPYDAIADLLGITSGTVGAALTQAHEELRGALQPEGVDR